MLRKVCIVTGSRAEYAHLQWLARELENDPRIHLQMLVTGSHLEPRFGETWREIEADGFEITARVHLDETDDTPLAIAKVIGQGTEKIAQALDQLSPDVLVILGDRYEMLAAASAALVLQIPIAHIHGGETTEGAIDEAIRHSITKISHLHFAAAEPYAKRIEQMGEAPDRIFNSGAPGLDILAHLDFLDRETIEIFLNFKLDCPFFLIAYHPVTVNNDGVVSGIEALLLALDHFPSHKVVFTGVNSDPNNHLISQGISDYASLNENRVCFVSSLGHLRYLSAMTMADAVIGNSSSGLIEAPALKIPTVNIGDRQKGRLAGASVVHCQEDAIEIVKAIHQVCSSEFKQVCMYAEPIYGQSNASGKIKEVLATVPLNGILAKSFHDLDVAV